MSPPPPTGTTIEVGVGHVLERSRGRPCPARRSRAGRRTGGRASGRSPRAARASRVERLGGVGGLEVDGRAVAARRRRSSAALAPCHMTTSASMPSTRGAVGERLRVVAGGDRDHAARLLLRRQRRELVQHAARLERAGALEELGLQETRADARRGSRAERRRAVQPPADRARGRRRRRRAASIRRSYGSDYSSRQTASPEHERARPARAVGLRCLHRVGRNAHVRDVGTQS